MSAFWQAKIWGLLHDPALKALHNNTGRGGEGFWELLSLMRGWQSPKESGKKILEHIDASDLIASASDRAVLGNLPSSVNYAPKNRSHKGLEISHLLSGAKIENWQFAGHQQLIAQSNRADYLNGEEQKIIEALANETDLKKLYWWLWRCFPVAVCRAFDDDSLMLMPAETRLPDASIWSHASITSALAGALAGYNLTADDIEKRWSDENTLSHPYITIFSFTPVQELIKASRKMRDFWAGSWILHYLSAQVCWKLANLYGPDCLLYPSLFQQPLIDDYLLRKYSGFSHWITPPTERQLLTAGFPNVLVLILPKDRVEAAMQTARQTLLDNWQDLSDRVFGELNGNRRWMSGLTPNSSTWNHWLKAQWQTYWTASPIGQEGKAFKNTAIPLEQALELQTWIDELNQSYNLRSKRGLFHPDELNFIRTSYADLLQQREGQFSVNVGSWWPFMFDQVRHTLSAAKNARTWQIPTAFGPRSTVSGLGPVVHPDREKDWITEGDTKQLWQRQAGLFDGREQLNATETLKRGLHKILPDLLKRKEADLSAAYPDLTSGVAGYLKTNQSECMEHFQQTCRAVEERLRGDKRIDLKKLSEPWGIPWNDENQNSQRIRYNPRCLNPGWLIEDLEISEEERDRYRPALQGIISQFYPQNNPTDWYVFAAGDGDDMSQWLKGKKMKPYRDYVSSELTPPASLQESFDKFLALPKRMGPSTHNALSRALLDFSNHLVPYLTEVRYAGRLIYGGGDDVLAYTNLWEWDEWLWDIHQCFQGGKDPKDEFVNEGDYWRKKSETVSDNLPQRHLFTMGHRATISFGIAIAHHSVPLAIALENLWEAEDEAKEYRTSDGLQKDAVQVRVLYGNGNILKATAKFNVFDRWRSLLNFESLESALFEQAASVWSQHPAPVEAAIEPWTKAFCLRRDAFKGDEALRDNFGLALSRFLRALYLTTEESDQRDRAIQNWLKLAAFVLRNRHIDLRGR